MKKYQSLTHKNGIAIHTVTWVPDEEAVGKIQIIHGLTEYANRYTPFAEFMTAKGFVVVASDIRGHGNSTNETATPMYLGGKGSWFDCVEDIYDVHTQMNEEFPNLPDIKLGFSMGSFLLRTAMILHPDMGDAAIIMGTGHQNPIALKLAKFMANKEAKKGYDQCTKVIDDLTFGTYNKKFAPNKTKFDWLCANEEAVQKYMDDPDRGDSVTVGLFSEMVDGMVFTANAKNIARMKKDTPVYLISGNQDPVGECGKGVTAAAKAFKAAGVQDVEMKLYPECRHDLFHEKCYKDVFNDIYAWIKSKWDF